MKKKRTFKERAGEVAEKKSRKHQQPNHMRSIECYRKHVSIVSFAVFSLRSQNSRPFDFFSIQFCFFCVYFFLYVVIARHFRRKTQQKIKHEKNKNGESMANLDKSMSTKKKTQRKTNWFGNSFVADFRSSFIRRSFSFWITAKMPTATFCSHSYFRLFHSFCLHLIYFVDCRTSDLTENSFVCFEHCSN